MEEIHEPLIDADPETSKKPRAAKWINSDSAVRVADLLVGALAIGVVFWWLQFHSTTAICCGDFDGYYHIRWARLLWENMRAGHLRPPAFPWLPLTTLSAGEYVDHHLLFHIILIPFTWFRDLQLGAKVAAFLFGSLLSFSVTGW